MIHRHLHVLLLFALGISVAGCFGARELPAVHQYSLDPQIAVDRFPQVESTLGIRPLATARPYGLSMVYLEGNARLGISELDAWAETPRDVVTRAITDALVAAGRFRDVGNAAAMARPDLLLTGELRKFLENRTVSPRTAEIEVRFELREARGANCLWAETLRVERPLEKQSAAAFAAAMNEAVGQVVSQAATAIAKAVPDLTT